jgi:adenosylcobyric acid synthase
MIKGFLINKFRGDPDLFDAGRAEIVRRTGWRDLGMAPWLAAARSLPAEDAVVLDPAVARPEGRLRIVVPMLSRIANSDDFDPLRTEPGVDFAFVPPGTPLPGDADLVILPGSKATLADLAFLRAQGWDIDIAAHVRRGGAVLGVCGGYQMLGRRICDPEGVEGPPGEAPGLGLLEVETVLAGDKVLRRSAGTLTGGGAFEGYEIHVGVTEGPGRQRPFLIHAEGRPDGAVSPDGRISGAYLHGLFDKATARAEILGRLGAASTGPDQSVRVDLALDELAVALEACFDIPAIMELAGLASAR